MATLIMDRMAITRHDEGAYWRLFLVKSLVRIVLALATGFGASSIGRCRIRKSALSS
jgi:hypothetical protein